MVAAALKITYFSPRRSPEVNCLKMKNITGSTFIMYLIVTATDFEIAPLRSALAGVKAVAFLVTGMGLVETTLKLTRYLAAPSGPGRRPDLQGVINFGVAGAFTGSGLELGDFCLARQEILGDLGICGNGEIKSFDVERLPVKTEFCLNNQLSATAEAVLRQQAIAYRTGRFVTVNCASGTRARGEYLRDRYAAICENMEGAAVARVCEEYGLPCLALRCISNWVEDRDPARWRLAAACEEGGRKTALLVAGLLASGPKTGA